MSYHCPTHGGFKTRHGYEFHSGWCESAWQVVERELVRVEVSKSAKPVRPPWAVGKTTRSVAALARSEGLNPYNPDAWDGFDPVVRKEFLAR